MAKKEVVEKSVEVQAAFIDRYEENWYVKKGSNKITFCKSIDDLISGNCESFDFIEQRMSVRIVKKDDKEIERNYFVIFILADNSMILVKRLNELK
jgi:hypothetical protein